MTGRIKAISLVALSLFALSACGGGDSTGADNPRALALSLSVPGGATLASSGPAPSAGFPVTFSDADSNTLTFTRVAIVVREIELKRQFTPDCDNSETGSGDSCEKFSTGPILFELPLDGQVTQVFSIVVPTDTYDELSFDIHKPSDDTPEDLAFIQQNQAFADISILAEGTFNSDPFVFTQRLNEEQEIQLSPPLTVEEGSAPANLTLELDIETWFTMGGGLVDPDSANDGGENENGVETNIKNSIDAFRDDDRSGRR